MYIYDLFIYCAIFVEKLHDNICSWRVYGLMLINPVCSYITAE